MQGDRIKLLLIRHGEVDYPLNKNGQKLTYGPEVGLSQTGKDQIASLADSISKSGEIPDIIVTSPFKRAQESAGILAQEFGRTIATEDDLRDVHVPGWIGVPMDEVHRQGGDIYSLDPRSDDQETLPELLERAKEALGKICEGKEGMRVAVVSHGDTLSAINWLLTREGKPSNYKELVNWGYLEKGQAAVFEVEGGKAVGEGRVITTEESERTQEGFRGGKERN